MPSYPFCSAMQDMFARAICSPPPPPRPQCCACSQSAGFTFCEFGVWVTSGGREFGPGWIWDLGGPGNEPL